MVSLELLPRRQSLPPLSEGEIFRQFPQEPGVLGGRCRHCRTVIKAYDVAHLRAHLDSKKCTEKRRQTLANRWGPAVRSWLTRLGQATGHPWLVLVG
jgi:hypothetical protein